MTLADYKVHTRHGGVRIEGEALNGDHMKLCPLFREKAVAEIRGRVEMHSNKIHTADSLHEC